MEGPTVVSALIHVATLVIVGVVMSVYSSTVVQYTVLAMQSICSHAAHVSHVYTVLLYTVLL